MTTLATRKMPVMFALSGAHEIPGIQGTWSIASEAAGVLILAARKFERTGGSARLGPHVMSPAWLPALVLEERVAELLRAQEMEVPANHRVPASFPLPPGLAGNCFPIVSLTLDLELGRERLEAIGGALHLLRDEGVVLVGIAQDSASTFRISEVLASVSLLLGAAREEDRMAELRTRNGGLGFVLVPDTDVLQDEDRSFWSVEAAGEMPLEVLEQLRPYLLADRSAEAGDE